MVRKSTVLSIIFIIFFVISTYLIYKKFSNKCSKNQAYNKLRKRCEPECSNTINTPYYDEKTNKCLICPPGKQLDSKGNCGDCNSEQELCGTTCFVPEHSKCIDNKICQKSMIYTKDGKETCCPHGEHPTKDGNACTACLEKLCEDGHCCEKDSNCCGKTCCNRDNEKCCNGKCYDYTKYSCVDGKTCKVGNSITKDDGTEFCCPPGQQPAPDKKSCTSCKDYLCPVTGTCCKKEERCCGKPLDRDGLCCNEQEVCIKGSCCDKTNVCTDPVTKNKICCPEGTECCNGKCCPEGACCGEKCCESGKKCVNGSCCANENVCVDNTTNKEVCCLGEDKKCNDGICKIPCGDTYCDLKTQECQSVKGVSGNIVNSCSNIESSCNSGIVAYDPELVQNNIPIINNGKVIPFCKVTDENGIDKFYTVKNVPGVNGPYERNSFYKLKGTDCTEGECLKTLHSNGEIFKQYTESTKKCYSDYDCDKLLPDYNSSDNNTKCPITVNGKPSTRCCIDKNDNTKYTGQVCPDNSVCDANGNCIYGYVFDKGVNSSDCISVTQKNKDKYTNLITNLTECRNANVSQMISCPSTKNPVWKYNKPFCWNNSLPTVCWANKDWTTRNNPYKNDKNIMNVLEELPKEKNVVYGTKCATGHGDCHEGDKKIVRHHADCLGFGGPATTKCISYKSPNILEDKLNVIYDPSCNS